MTDSLLVYTDCFFLCVFLSDITEKTELKTFFESNCSQIYFIFYENFITLESNLKQKGKKHPALLSSAPLYLGGLSMRNIIRLDKLDTPAGRVRGGMVSGLVPVSVLCVPH